MIKFKHYFLLMLLSLCSIASHAYDFEVDGLYYNLISASDKTCELVGGNDNLTQITIPNAITVRNQNLSVVSMSSSAFKNKTNAVSVSFRESAITEIPSNAFYACTQLSSVVLSAQFKFSVASSRGANQRWCIHDTGRTGCPQCHAAVL